uniref:1-alkyl-2-acetylglycerophosphocholine esterase n=1 Tax=Paramoeba aestuarina TaxID=180227 RepID=A0A7S4UE33_9EUKA
MGASISRTVESVNSWVTTPKFATLLASPTTHPTAPPPSSPFVGVYDGKTDKVRFRVFYPASPPSSPSPSSSSSQSFCPKQHGKQVPLFYDGLGKAVLGYLHTMSPLHSDTFLFSLLSPLLRITSDWFIPLSYARLPSAHHHLSVLPPSSSSGYPLIVFSHGLTGSGEEHGSMFSHWARQGFIVVTLNHCDGSSSRAVDAQGKEIFYHHPPGLKGRPGVYPEDYRQKQVEKRGEELYHITQAILSSSSCLPPSLSSVINPNKIIAAGFSYGATTVAQAIATHPNTYSAALLLDGWFALDLASITSCPSNEIIPFPSSAHTLPDSLSTTPCCFIGTTAFQNVQHLRECTEVLREKSGEGSEAHVLDDTIHWSFVDLVFWLSWLSSPFYKRVAKMSGINPRIEESYVELFELTTKFLLKVAQKEKEE